MKALYALIVAVGLVLTLKTEAKITVYQAKNPNRNIAASARTFGDGQLFSGNMVKAELLNVTYIANNSRLAWLTVHRRKKANPYSRLLKNSLMLVFQIA